MFGSHKAGRSDVRKQDCLVIVNLVRKFHQSNVRERNARFFRLQSVERARIFRATKECCSCGWSVGICVVALGVVAGTAVGTISATEVDGITTRSPGERLRTPLPTCSTIPTPS